MLKINNLFKVLPLLILLSCTDDPQVFRGIEIGGKVTKIELSAATFSDITQTSATITTEAIALDGNLPVSEHGHVWSTTVTEPTTSNSKTELGELVNVGNFESQLTNLVPNTTYFVRAYVVTDNGTGYSNQVNVFTTGDAPADVLIINEGNFLSGDGSLTTYQSLTGEIQLSAFAAANGFPIGATVQNVIPFGDNYYMVTNSPDNLEIIDQETLESEDVINGLENPISFAAVGTKGYVSNWGDIATAFGPNPDSFISIIDLTTNTITGTIDLTSRPQELLAYGEKVYVANEGGSTVSVIDTNTDMITDIPTAFGPSDLVVDANEHIWALCSGGFLVEIDPATDAVVQTIDNVAVSGFDEKMSINGDSTIIYFLSLGVFPSTDASVYKFNITDTDAPATALIDGNNFYGVGVHPESDEIYLGNSNGFISNGTVFLYDNEGTEITNFGTGIGPNGFVFR